MSGVIHHKGTNFSWINPHTGLRDGWTHYHKDGTQWAHPNSEVCNEGEEYMNIDQKLGEAFNKISRQNDALFIRKQQDYGPGNIAKFGSMGVLVRISDKVERLINLTKTGKGPHNEALEDSWRDIAVYAQIAILCDRGLWPGVGGKLSDEYRPTDDEG